MRIAVTGADGFLGSHVLERLRNEDGYEVLGITVCPEDLKSRFEGWCDLTIVPADLRVMEESQDLEDVDVFLNCAYPRVTGAEGMAEGLDFVYGSIGLMLDKGCKSVINVSSQSVYNPQRSLPAKEDDTLLLVDTYAATKYCVELSVARMCKDKGVPCTNVRLASMIGPGFDQRFVNKMVKAAIQTRRITVLDNGSRFGFLDVTEGSEGLVRLMKTNPQRWDSVYNLGPREAYGISQIAGVVAREVVRHDPIARHVDVIESKGEGPVTCTAVDSSRLSAFLGWCPSLGIDDSIRSILFHELGVEGPC